MINSHEGDESVTESPGGAFVEHMLYLIVDSPFSNHIPTQINSRLEAAEHLVESGEAATEEEALQTVVDMETEMREAKLNGEA